MIYPQYCVFTCGQFSAGGFRDPFLRVLRFVGFPLQGAMTFDLVVTPVVSARGAGSLPDRGGRILAGGAGGLGPTPVRSHPETQ